MNNAIKDHIEANYIEGIVIPCNICEKNFQVKRCFETPQPTEVFQSLIKNFQRLIYFRTASSKGARYLLDFNQLLIAFCSQIMC